MLVDEVDDHTTFEMENAMNEAERYARNRLDNLIGLIAGCLTPTALDEVIADIEESAPRPMSEDLILFVERMRVQRSTLVGDEPTMQRCDCGAEGFALLIDGKCDVCRGVI